MAATDMLNRVYKFAIFFVDVCIFLLQNFRSYLLTLFPLNYFSLSRSYIFGFMMVSINFNKTNCLAALSDRNQLVFPRFRFVLVLHNAYIITKLNNS
jgi:hypothetical protein